MILKGRVWRFGDGISTDHIIPGRYFHLRSNLPELAQHVFEDADPAFARSVKRGDIVVAGRNFGLGSSREHAPVVIKMAGVSAVLARSAARIFFRNAINVGLPVLICDTERIAAGDLLEIDLSKGRITDVTAGLNLESRPLPDAMMKILSDGGLVEHLKKNGGYAL